MDADAVPTSSSSSNITSDSRKVAVAAATVTARCCCTGGGGGGGALRVGSYRCGVVLLLLWYSAAAPSVVSVRKPTRRPSLKTRHYQRPSVYHSLSLSLCLARRLAVKSDGISAAAAAESR